MVNHEPDLTIDEYGLLLYKQSIKEHVASLPKEEQLPFVVKMILALTGCKEIKQGSAK